MTLNNEEKINMMTTFDTPQNTAFEDLMLKEAASFDLDTSNSDEPIYRWVDTNVSNLPTPKLEDIVRLSELPDCDVDAEFLDAVIIELLCRRSGFIC